MTHSNARSDDSVPTCEAYSHPSGWFLLRETDSTTGWLSTDAPVPVER
jgi:hypothetical protein